VDKLKDNFWFSKKILITGHTGYVGTWLNYFLCKNQADIYGVSLKKNPSKIFRLLSFNKKKSFFFNIVNYSQLEKIAKKIKPEIIIHLAAQPLVLDSYIKPIETYESNMIGTLNILRVVRKFNFIKTAVFFTTDKVYKNNDKKKIFNETDSLNGDDPYSGSKAASEIIINSFTKSFLQNKNVIVLRAGNIIGGGDYTKTRLIPDIILASLNKRKVRIRNKNAIRPWQHIMDVIFLIKGIIEKVHKNNNFYDVFNIGPMRSKITVKQILKIIKKYFKVKEIFLKKNIKEKNYIILNSTKIKKIFGLSNNLTEKEALSLTIAWYKNFHFNKLNVKKLFDGDFLFYNKKIK
jgi:CDP-glucose 4,6-dehydratase